MLCDDALDVPLGRRPIRASRLNADGTPFEFVLSLGAAPSPLQFLVDPGPPSASTSQRREITAATVPELARLLEVDDRAADVLGFLDEFAPAGDANLQADASGAAWLGVAFSSDARPAMKVYVNAKWGAPERRTARMLAFSSWFGLGDRWREVEGSAAGLEPLGVALTSSGDRLRGRAYLAGFGQPFRRYERLASSLAGPALERRIRRYGQVMLGEDYVNPTRAVVCSIGMRPGGLTDVKIELCAHCAFDDDAQARERCLRWLDDDGVGSAAYSDLVDVLGGSRGRGVHAYVGVSGLSDAGSSTFYFNPAAGC